MVSKNKKQNFTIDELLYHLDENSDVRASVINFLAQKHSKDFLSRVQVEANHVEKKGLRVNVVSNKEWQE